MRLSIILICLALAGCGSKDATTTVPDVVGKDPGPYPTAYKAILAQHLKEQQSLRSDSLRDVELSAPVPWQFSSNKGWLVCLRANAKNQSGNADAYLVSSAGGVDDLIGDVDACKNAKYESWPEIDTAQTSTHGSPKK